jgi:hypothetical protein
MEDTVRQRRLAWCETLNTVCWVSLDVSWFFQAKTAAVTFAVPTVLTCVAAVLLTERKAAPLLVACAIAFWAHFNVFWVLGDLKMLDWGLAAAHVFIALLTVALTSAFAASAFSKDAREVLLARFRRLRLRRREK